MTAAPDAAGARGIGPNCQRDGLGADALSKRPAERTTRKSEMNT